VHFLRRACVLAVFVLSAVALGADLPVYFPGELDSDKANHYAPLERGYAELLVLLKEPPLCCKSAVPARTFRFTWNRTFHRPIALRLEEQADGTWLLYTKIANGAGGYDWGSLEVNKRRVVPTTKANALVAKLAPGTRFWSLPVRDDRVGLDGAGWIIEARSGDEYHYIIRWSPEKGEVRDIGLAFIALSDLGDEKVY
jgi:hypothetical protein